MVVIASSDADLRRRWKRELRDCFRVRPVPAQGASNKEIAATLRISEKTVKSHLTTIFRKVGVTDRLRLALLVTTDGRISRPHAN